MDGQMELRTVMTKLIVTFCNFADTPDCELHCTLCNYCTNGDMFRHQKACTTTRQCSTALINYFIVIRFNLVAPELFF